MHVTIQNKPLHVHTYFILYLSSLAVGYLTFSMVQCLDSWLNYLHVCIFHYALLIHLNCIVINVGLGIALFESNGCGRARYTILWVYIVFVILLLIFQAIQFVVFTISTLRSPPESMLMLHPVLCFIKFL